MLNLAGRSVAPGFIDLQVNRGGGVLLPDSPTVEAVRAVRDAHRRSSGSPTMLTLGRVAAGYLPTS